MGAFWGILIIVIILFILVKKGKQKKQDSISVRVSVDKSNRTEDLTSKSIFDTEYPFFYALKTKNSFSNSVSDIPLAKELARINNEDHWEAIYKMVEENRVRGKTDLPVALRAAPIQKFIEKGIFTNTTEQDVPELLNKYYKAPELKELCKKKGLPAGGKKDEIIERLLPHLETSEIDLNRYFKASEDLINLFDQFNKYFTKLVEDKFHHVLYVVNKKPKIDEDTSLEAENDTIQIYNSYGDGYIVRINNKTKFVIAFYNEFPLVEFYLTKNKIVSFYTKHIRSMRVANISLINLEGQILNENVLINVNYHPTYIKEHNIYYIEYTDGRVFVLDLNTNKSYVLENPDKVDIYTLLEANNK